MFSKFMFTEFFAPLSAESPSDLLEITLTYITVIINERVFYFIKVLKASYRFV